MRTRCRLGAPGKVLGRLPISKPDSSQSERTRRHHRSAAATGREAITALIVANQFLETNLGAAMSTSHLRGMLPRDRRNGATDVEREVLGYICPWPRTAALNGLIPLGIRSLAAPRSVLAAITVMLRGFRSVFAASPATHLKQALI